MTTPKRLIAAGLATFIAGIAVTFPARIAYNWLAPPGLRLSGISGTVWNGAAAEGSASGLYLRDIRWHVLPKALFRGRLAYSIESDTSFGSIRSDVGVTIGGAVVLNRLDSVFSLQAFGDQFQLQGFDGTLNVRFDTLVVRNGFPTDAVGTVRLSNLMARQISPDVIGDYQAEFTSGPNGVTGNVEDLGGVLDVAGSISLSNDRSYAFTGTVAALPGAPRGLTDQLRLLGSADAQGRREFRIEGQL